MANRINYQLEIEKVLASLPAGALDESYRLGELMLDRASFAALGDNIRKAVETNISRRNHTLNFKRGKSRL